jgi:DNA polymerase beta
MNQKLCDMFEEIRDYEKLVRNEYKYRAYEKVLKVIKSFSFEIKSISRLKNISGIGKKTLIKIKEYLDTGTMNRLEEVRKEFNSLNSFLNIYGVGLKKAIELYKKNILTIDDLKHHTNILNQTQKIGLKYFDELNKKIPRVEIQKFEKYIKKFFPIIICGSYRRKLPYSRDIDIIIDSKYKDKLDSLDIIKDILISGEKIVSAVCIIDKIHRKIDFRFVNKKDYWFSVLYFTGSKEFNIYIRSMAKKKGIKLNEYSSGKHVDSEKDIFEMISLKYIPPHKRNM